MSTILLELPGDILDATRLDEASLKAELAVHLFEQDRLSFGKACELSGLEPHAFLSLLGARSIPVHYGVREYESDKEVITRLRIP